MGFFLFLISTVCFILQCTASPMFASTKFNFDAVIVGHLPTERGDTAAFYDGDNSIYIIGGRAGDALDSVMFDEILKYNLTSNTVEVSGHFPVPITQGSIGTDGEGGIYYIGGVDSTSVSSVIWRFTLQNLIPSHVADLPIATTGQSTASDGNGNIYIIGGMAEDYTHMSTILKYTNGQVTAVGNLEKGLYETSSVWAKESVFIIGGISDDGSHSQLQKFNPSTGEVEVVGTNMTTALVHTTAVNVMDNVYMFGGLVQTYHPQHQLSRLDTTANSVEYFELAVTGVWRGSSAVYVEKLNRIYVFGGFYYEYGFEFARTEIMYIQLC